MTSARRACYDPGSVTDDTRRDSLASLARLPRFAHDFPRMPELDALVEAFARGDYARVRADARNLASHDDAAVRDAAHTLVDRTKPDPLVLILLGIAATLFVVIAAWSMGK
jgi:hypothetical protein